MPIYEFYCNTCQKKVSLFVRSITSSLSPICPSCGNKNLSRVISSFAFHKSEKTILEEAGDPDHPDLDYYKDPRTIGRWAEKKLQGMGIDMDSDEYKDTFSEVQGKIAAAREGDMSILDRQDLIGMDVED